MTPNERLQDAFIDRQIDITRYSNRAVRQILKLIAKVEADTLEKLNAAPDGSNRQAQLEAFLIELRALYARGYAQVSAATEQELRDLTGDELAFSAAALERGAQAARINTAVQIPFLEQVYAAAASRPFQGRLLREWLTGLEEGAANRVRDAIRIGYVEGESIAAIKARVRRIMPISARGAEAMVRTAINHTAQSAREDVFRANADIIEGEVWNAVLDARTSAVCRGRDGKQYPLGKGPRPPAHINCRSYMSPVLIGIEPAPRTDYGTWLKRQPVEKQDEILGKAKGRLFREGGLTLDRFVDRAGNEYTLEQLRSRHADAFQAAFGEAGSGRRVKPNKGPIEEWQSARDWGGSTEIAQRQIMEKTRQDGNEWAALVDRESGEVFGLNTLGKSDSVKLKAADEDRADKVGKRAFDYHHSHPGDVPFSRDDIAVAPKWGAMYAHGDLGSTYKISEVKPEAKDIFKDAEDRAKKTLDASKGMSISEASFAWDQIAHIILLEMDKKGYLRYEYALAPSRFDADGAFWAKPKIAPIVKAALRGIK